MLLLVLGSTSTSAASGALHPRFYGETGGFIKFPNSLQIPDRANAIGIAWIKGGVSLYNTAKSSLNLVAQGTYSRDSKPFVWNNSVTLGIGAEFRLKLTDHLNVSAIARHDWYVQSDGVRKDSNRYFVNYSFFKNWPRDGVKLDQKFRRVDYIFTSNGALAFPSSLDYRNNNILLTAGAELSMILRAKEKKISLIPNVIISFSIYRYAYNYNNKLVPTIGIKIRYPLEKGQILLGTNYGTDFRWIDNTRNSGFSIFLNWNKSL